MIDGDAKALPAICQFFPNKLFLPFSLKNHVLLKTEEAKRVWLDKVKVGDAKALPRIQQNFLNKLLSPISLKYHVLPAPQQNTMIFEK